MITLGAFMVVNVVIFSLMGMLRGWYKEVLVTASISLGVFVISLADKYVAAIHLLPEHSPQKFLVRGAILVFLVFFGYQTPRWRSASRSLGTLQSALLGLFLGGLNGYLLIGLLWYYLAQAGYPWPQFVRPPNPADTLSVFMEQHLPYMFLGLPGGIQSVVAIAFVFIIVFLV